MSTTAWGVIGGVLGFLPSLFRKRTFCLWYLGMDAKWRKKSEAMSYRQCRKTRAALIALGSYEKERFVILRKGVEP